MKIPNKHHIGALVAAIFGSALVCQSPALAATPTQSIAPPAYSYPSWL